MAINGMAVAAGTAGIILAWSALHNKSVLATLKDVIKGKAPVPGPQGIPVAGPGTTSKEAAVSGLSPGGTSFNGAQLRSLWVMAGGSQATAQNAACHGMQESGGNARAVSSNPDGGTNVGLWQLDTPGGVGAGYTVEQLMDPVLNARITVAATKNGTDWTDWATPGC